MPRGEVSYDFSNVNSRIEEVNDLALIMDTTMTYESIEIDITNSYADKKYVISKDPEMYYSTDSNSSRVRYYIRNRFKFGTFDDDRIGWESDDFAFNVNYIGIAESFMTDISELHSVLMDDNNIELIEKTEEGFLLTTTTKYNNSLIENDIDINNESLESVESRDSGVSEGYVDSLKADIANLKSTINIKKSFEVIVEDGIMKKILINDYSEITPNEYNGYTENLVQNFDTIVEVVKFNQNEEIADQIMKKYKDRY